MVQKDGDRQNKYTTVFTAAECILALQSNWPHSNSNTAHKKNNELSFTRAFYDNENAFIQRKGSGDTR